MTKWWNKFEIISSMKQNKTDGNSGSETNYDAVLSVISTRGWSGHKIKVYKFTNYTLSTLPLRP